MPSIMQLMAKVKLCHELIDRCVVKFYCTKIFFIYDSAFNLVATYGWEAGKSFS